MQKFIVKDSKRLDKLLVEQFSGYSRAYFQYLIALGSVKKNGKVVKKRDIPKVGDYISLTLIDPPKIELKAQNIPLNILYEDNDIICIDKPAGMVVHPAPGHHDKTLVNALLYHCGRLPDQDLRPGIVHRLDRDTSGVMIAAKTILAHQKLTELFAERKIKKTYRAITIGNPDDQSISAPILRHPLKRKEMKIHEKGRNALTLIESIATKGEFSLVQAKPVTGRTHQIRIHLKHVKTPILGDLVYGPEKLALKLGVKRQLLHSYKILFNHPISGKEMQFTAHPPKDFKFWSENIECQ